MSKATRPGVSIDFELEADRLPTQEFLRELFDYRPDTGKLIWKEREVKTWADKRFNSLYAHRGVRGSVNNQGYRNISIKATRFAAHRIIYKWLHGPIPDGHIIDHVNGVTGDNRSSNLRLATMSQNQWNRGPRKGDREWAHLPKGVTYVKAVRKYRVDVCRNRNKEYLGLFTDLQQAVDAYNARARELHGEYFKPSVIESLDR